MKYYATPESEEDDIFIANSKGIERPLHSIQAGVTETIRFLLVDKNAGIVDSDTLKKIILETRVAHLAINLSWQDVFF